MNITPEFGDTLEFEEIPEFAENGKLKDLGKLAKKGGIRKMKFYRPGEGRAIQTNGTSLQGVITIGYDKLVSIFGEPTSEGDGYKVDAEWELVFEDGIVATIYNYKDGVNYNGKDGNLPQDITDWHIGGHTKTAVQRIEQVLSKVEGNLPTQG